MKKSIKKIITSFMAILTFALCMGLFSPTLQSQAAATDYTKISEGASAAKATDQAKSLFDTGGIFVKITNTALFLIGAISVVMLIYGGIRYTVSGGESGAVTNAKNTILYAIVGIIVAILAYAVVGFVVDRLVS